MRFLYFIVLIGGSYTVIAQTASLEKVNSSEVEFSPSISAEGDYMIFQSDKDADEFSDESIWKLYTSHKFDGMWSEPVEIININNNVSFAASPNISYDGNTLFITAFVEGITESEDIYFSTKNGETWGAPVSMGAPINTAEFYEGYPSISSDENSLYFVRVNEDNPWDKRNKENCFKIFVSHRISESEWSEPEALPAPINMGCEHAPKIMADNKTLIFSSIRNDEKKGFDLYQSTLIGDNKWSEPIALNYLNTKKSDLSPAIPASGDIVYYGLDDQIASATVPEEFRQAVNITLHGVLIDKYKKAPLDGFINVIDKTSGKMITTHHTNSESGRYSLVLQTGKSFQLVYGAQNYGNVEMEYDLTEVEEYEARELNLELEQALKTAIIVKDAELEAEFHATIKISENSGKLTFDELKIAAGEASKIKLPAGLTYSLVTEAKNYLPDTLNLDLRELPSNQDDIIVALQPKKVPVSISLGGLSDGKKRKVRVKNERTGETIEADDNQTLLLRSGERYKVIVNSEKGYAYASSEIDLTNADEEAEDVSSKVYAAVRSIPKENKEDTPKTGSITIEIPMVKLETGTQITMEQILFETNSAEIDESSFSELDQLTEMMNTNPELRIEISAHTDDVGSDAINLDLSQKRAQSVANYLISKGVPENKFQVKGYGEAKPRVANNSAENRAKNRRVEFIVID